MSILGKPAARTAVVAAAAALSLAACGGSNGGGGGASGAATSTVATSSAAGITSNPSLSIAGSPTGGPSTSFGNTAAGSPTSSADQIKQVWEAFFSGATPENEKVGLLQNGSQFAAYIHEQKQSATAQQASAQVTNVQVNGTTAQVTYNVLLNNQPVLQNQSGQAVLVDNQWKVSQQAFCSLLQLQGSVPTQCTMATSAAPGSGATASSGG